MPVEDDTHFMKISVHKRELLFCFVLSVSVSTDILKRGPLVCTALALVVIQGFNHYETTVSPAASAALFSVYQL